MLSYPDFTEKQLAFIHCERGVRSRLSIQNRNIVYRKDDEVQAKLSLYKLFVLFVIGEASLTTPFIADCRHYGVSLILMKWNCNISVEIYSQAEGNTVLRFRQYHTDKDLDLLKAKILITNKILNQLRLVCDTNPKIGAYKELKRLATSQVKSARNNAELRGIEGYYARLYFKYYFEDIGWWKRAPQSRHDIQNLLMDMGYTYLFNFIEALLRVHGFDTYRGFYHTLFFSRKSLACDIMEPFRPIIDREIRKAYTLGKIDLKDFTRRGPEYQLNWKNSAKYNQIFLEAIMNQKEPIFRYIRHYYRHVMDPEEHQFPEYKLRVK